MSRTAALMALLLALAPTLHAHRVASGVGSALQVIVQEDRVRLTFDLGFGRVWARAEMLSMDTNRDGHVNEEEAAAYRRKSWEETVAPHLRVRLNGIEAPFRLTGSRSDTLVGDIGLVPFDIYYDLEVEIPFATSADRNKRLRLEVENRVLQKDTTRPPLFYIPYSGHDRRCSFLIEAPTALADLQNYIAEGRGLILIFECSGGQVPQEDARLLDPRQGGSPSIPPSPESPSPAEPVVTPEPSRPAPDPEEERRLRPLERELRQRLGEPIAGLAALGVLLLIAFVTGAAHGVVPATVALYLLATAGRVRDTLLLAAGAIALPGVLALFAGPDPLAGNRVVAGAGLLVLGLWLFSRLRRPAAPADGTSSRERWISAVILLALGGAAGLIPSAGASAIVDDLHRGGTESAGPTVLALVAHVFGTAAVLAAVGALLVTARNLFVRDAARHATLTAVAARITPLLLLALGSFYLVRSFLAPE